MAKRKRLTPAQPDYLESSGSARPAAGLAMGSAAPIAQVANEAATQAALSELTEVLESARADGRLIERLPLEAVDEAHLVRDRIEQDEEEMASLMASLRARGQQTPIEVVPLAKAKDGKTHGLVSGWRRLTALKRLYAEGSESEFATVKAQVIHPDSAGDAYLAMVEENEIRVNLSHYERARIAVRAMQEGVFDSQRAALQGLFGNATRSKRSKIGSFITLVEAFDDVLYFPAAISEKLGLGLVREMTRDPYFAQHTIARLKERERETAPDELWILASAVDLSQDQILYRVQELPPEEEPAAPAPPVLAPAPEPASATVVHRETPVPGVTLEYTAGKRRVTLQGEKVSVELAQALIDWLKARHSGS